MSKDKKDVKEMSATPKQLADIHDQTEKLKKMHYEKTLNNPEYLRNTITKLNEYRRVELLGCLFIGMLTSLVMFGLISVVDLYMRDSWLAFGIMVGVVIVFTWVLWNAYRGIRYSYKANPYDLVI